MSSILGTALEKVRGAKQDRRRTVEKGNAHKVTTEGTVVERRPVRETTWSRLLDSIDFPSFSFHQGAIRLLYPGVVAWAKKKNRRNSQFSSYDEYTILGGETPTLPLTFGQQRRTARDRWITGGERQKLGCQ
ncbi:hypothetical protein DAPPUDRAFT_114471 [Daphnia pulex]|uniref:Uncharacterized protein n=1 Tax=Daphnia pulex TaxID=6669 RepID=E9HI94_DAPPU|nr:hypothetical protein DAPPUDRAFT_114471 [Daphnia pulex]|eukprot:EFX68547.1 hypothetical protein DAPPUDRAFT_114471 [Daphnia pulex]